MSLVVIGIRETPVGCHKKIDDLRMEPCAFYDLCKKCKWYEDPYKENVKPEKCCIVGEIPVKHGRLKDESTIIENMEKAYCEIAGKHESQAKIDLINKVYQEMLRAVFQSPAILEASK